MEDNFLGRYKIIREIGRSNDIVYEAIDPSINRRVALKELLLPQNLDGAQKRERIERFYREARAAGSLSHPNIVTIFEVGEDKGRHFIAMEYLEGQTLRDILEIEGHLSVDKAIDITKQVCDALAYAHSRGVVHRDIKPDNIQIIPGGHVKLTDFGIARIMDEPTLTASGQVFGTPSYMSPEQVEGKAIDARSDIFSLGVMLFEMLVGRKPFTGDTVVTITYNIMNQDVNIPPSVPDYLDRVIKRCLAKNPDMRYCSTTEVAAELQPGSYNYTTASPLPSPYDATMSMPSPMYGTPAPTPVQTPPVPQPDPFRNLRPGDLSLPKAPRKPLLSDDAKYFVKVMLAVIVGCAMVIGLIYVLTMGYRGWLQTNNQGQADVFIKAGNDYYNSQSYNAAIDRYNQALKLDLNEKNRKTLLRNVAVCYVQLGIQAENNGDFAGAMNNYNQAAQTDNTYGDAYLRLGDIEKKMGRDEDAIAAWNQAIALGGEAADTAREDTAAMYLTRGDQAANSGDNANATTWWQKALETGPGTKAGNEAQKRLEGTK